MRFLVIGLNSMGRKLARELSHRGSVTAADKDPKKIARIKDEVDRAVCLDTTDALALETLDVHQYDHTVVCMSQSFEAAELTTLALMDLGAKSVTNVASTARRRDILEAIGAERVLTPGLLQARNLAVALSEPAIAHFWFVESDQGLGEVIVGRPCTLKRDVFASFFGPAVRFVGVRRADAPADSRFDIKVSEGVDLAPGDILLLFGTPDDIASFARRKLGRS